MLDHYIFTFPLSLIVFPRAQYEVPFCFPFIHLYAVDTVLYATGSSDYYYLLFSSFYVQQSFANSKPSLNFHTMMF